MAWPNHAAWDQAGVIAAGEGSMGAGCPVRTVRDHAFVVGHLPGTEAVARR
jgi:hypothetical protein